MICNLYLRNEKCNFQCFLDKFVEFFFAILILFKMDIHENNLENRTKKICFTLKLYKYKNVKKHDGFFENCSINVWAIYDIGSF